METNPRLKPPFFLSNHVCRKRPENQPDHQIAVVRVRLINEFSAKVASGAHEGCGYEE